jgi:acetyl-CoA carboxylase biotin carboxyl carrier protein
MTNDAAARADGSEGGLRSISSLSKDVAQLVKYLEGSTVSRLAIETGGIRIEIERNLQPAAHAGGGLAGPTAAAEVAGAATAPADNRHAVRAPLVGTFYRSAQPGSKPFVEVGDVVDAGQTLAIVEAMKIMNQVQADRAGRVAEIALKDGDWVEFEQALVYLEPVES